MAPAKNVRRGRPLRHSPVATRSRAAARCAAVARSAMCPPPPECHVVQHFDDEPALQQVVRLVAGAAAGRKATTEERLSNLERRLESSDKMLQEVHAMVRGLQQLPAANALPAPPPVAAPAAMAASAEEGPLANLCLRPQDSHTSGRATSSAAGAPPSPVQPCGQRLCLQVFIQVRKYTPSPGHPRI